MTLRPGPAWLQAFQQQFGAMLRTPLARSAGRLQATPDAYPPPLVESATPGKTRNGVERLAIYNRQYWFRLFTVLHGAYPLTTRLLGHWDFNAYANAYLLQAPPTHWDIDQIGDGLVSFLERTLQQTEVLAGRGSVSSAALIEAAQLDAAFHRVFRAPDVPPYAPSATDAARLPEARLVPSPAVALTRESWPLAELRRRALADAGETPLELPARLEPPRHSLLLRDGLRLVLVPLEPLEHLLMALLSRMSLGDALAELLPACPPEQRSALPEAVQRWLAVSVQRGCWIGIQ